MGNYICLTNKHHRVSNNVILDILRSEWAGSVLEWSEQDLTDFASCFELHKVKAGSSISLKDRHTFFIVAEGSCEIQAIMPTIRKKTGNIRQFLCKKDSGDMVYLPSIKKLVSDSNAQELYDKEEREHRGHYDHKNLLDLIDTVSIKSIENTKILKIDWMKYEDLFATERSTDSRVNVKMLRIMMETNLTDHLTRLPFLTNVHHTKLETLVRMCRYRVEKHGTVICKEGEVGDEVFFVLSGEVIVEAKASKRVVELFGEGGIIGNGRFSCINNKSHRRGSSTQLDKADIANADRLFFASSNEQRGDNHSCSEVDERCSERRLIDSDSLTNHNQRMTRLFTGSQSIELARLGPGEYFGVMSAFTELPRSATVTSLSNVLMATLSKHDFKSFMKTSPLLEPHIEQSVKCHMLMNLFQLKSPFLEQISPAQANKLASRAEIRKLNAGMTVFEEGEDANDFYFVYSGSLKVEKSNKKTPEERDVVGHLYSGDYFGELAIVNRSKRTASVTTTSKTIMLVINRSAMYHCFDDDPQVLSEFIMRMKGKNATLRDVLDFKNARDFFARYAKKVYCGESLEFYEIVQSFKLEYDDCKPNEVKRKAKSIFDNFLAEGGSKAVNAPDSIYKEVEKCIKNDNYDKEMFIRAENEIFTLMERDIFVRFKKDDSFFDLLEQIKAYDDVDLELLA